MATATATKSNGRSRVTAKEIAETASVEITPTSIVLTRLERDTLTLRVVGTAPLIVHRFDEKAREALINKPPRGGVKEKREEAFKQRAFEASMYRFDDGGHGFPAGGFKAAIVSAAEAFPKLYGSTVKRWLRVEGETIANGENLVRLEVGEPRRREDYVRLKSAMGKVSTDMRWRAEYWPWAASVRIVFPSDMFPPESILALLDAAGFGGIGEWRPNSPESKTGAYGTFEVATDAVRGR